MGTIILSTEVDILLKEYMKNNEQKIKNSENTKHKKPSYNETLLFILKKDKVTTYCVNEFKKIEGKNQEERKQIEHLIKQIADFC
jgi:hypothetical protein